jgi:predicted CxxxxCH...CXXCH cytochrome family protein
MEGTGMNSKFAKWGLIQLLTIIMVVAAGNALAAGEALMHNSNNLGTKYGNWGVIGGKYGEFTCTTCHNTSTNNVKRVQATLTAPLGSWSSSKATTVSVVFNNMTAFGTDAAAHATSTAICQACHSKTAYHRYNKPAGQANSNHENANQTDCTSCHSHATAFKPSCNTCHGYPPSAATLGVNGLVTPETRALGNPATVPGGHMAHDGLGMKCATCHNGYDSTLHRTSGKIEIGFAINNTNYPAFGTVAAGTGSFVGNNALNTATGSIPASYSWQGNGGTTVTTAAGTTTCNVYCHGNWVGANGGANPSWVGGTAEKACGACHGASAAATPTTNAHARHAATLSPTTLGIACDKCHGAHPDNSHVNGQVKWDLTTLPNAVVGSAAQYKAATVSNTGAPAPSASFGNCSNTYCHSNVQGVNGTGAPTSFATPTWSASSVNCDSCHWADGLSGSFKLISTGSHRAHVSRGYSFTCSNCHSGAGSASTKHADGIVQVSMTLGSYTSPTKAFTKSVGKIAGVGGYGSCSNTACHTTNTPAWGGTLAGNCQGCHGNEVNAATALSGVHNNHLNLAITGGAFKCADCHSLVITNSDNRTIANKTLHANSVINYSGARAGGSAKYSTATKTCSTIYCHSNGKGIFVSMTGSKKWTGAANFQCNGCHGRSGVTGAPDNVAIDSHAKHAPTAAQCFRCHYKTAGKTAGQLVSGTVDHLDGNIDARLTKVSALASYSGVYNTTARTCSATYCHGGAVTTPVWGAGSTNCNSCHNSKPNGLSASHAFHIMSTSGNYNYGQAVSNNSTALAYSFNCSTCHGNNVSLHADGPVALGSDATIQFMYSSAGRGANATAAYVRYSTTAADVRGFNYRPGAAGACNNTYCHSNGKAVPGNGASATLSWVSATTGTCTACHGNEANAATLSGAHDNHINKASTGGKFLCKDCHAKTITNVNNRTLADKSKHVNKMIDYSGLSAGKNRNCSNIYCHSNGKGTFATIPAWTSATVLGCNGCHGTSNLFGRPDNSTPNSHTIHASSGSDCYKCHRLTASQTAGQLVSGTIDHLDGNIDARFSKMALTNYSGVYNTGKTCSATYCHGGGVTSPAWGSAGPLACNTCHAANNTLPGAHSIHVNATVPSAGGYTLAAANTSAGTVTNFTCASCHGNTAANHANGPVVLNSDATIFFGFSSFGKNPAYTRTGTVGTDTQGFKWMAGAAGACNATYCHSNGQGGAGALGTIAWNSSATAACNSCHGNEANAATLSGAHNKHITGTAGGSFKCKDCHAPTITNADNRTLADKSKHVNKMVNYSGTYAGKNKTCATIYCHSNGKGSFSSPVWTGTNAVGCAYCHATSGLTTGSHAKHIAKGATCKYCHSGTTTNDTTITGTQHIDGTVNLVPGGTYTTKAVSFTPVGTTCNNISCHDTRATGPYTSSATWGVAATCETCHPKAGLSGAHLTHMGALNLTNASILYNMTANRTPAVNDASGTHGYGCANCHPISATNHLNGTVDVDLNRVNVAGVSTLRFLNHSTAGYSGGKCSNMYCHSNASRLEEESNVKSNTSLAWTDKFANYTGASAGVNRKDRCAQCHGNQPTTGAHVAHAISNHSDNIYNGKNGKVGFSGTGNSAHGNPNTTTTITCYICHSATVDPNAHGNDKNDKCKGCHGVTAPLKGTLRVNNIANHVNGLREIQFAPIKVRSKAQVRPESFKWYTAVWSRTYYKNMTSIAFDESKVPLNTATMWHYSSAKSSNCSNLACHNGYKAVWNMQNWNDPNKCMDCHFKL